MNAVVEVGTAQAQAQAVKTAVCVFSHAVFPMIVALSGRVFSTSTLHIISQGSHSISAVAPDTNSLEGI